MGFRVEEIHHGVLGEVTDVDTTTMNTLFVVTDAADNEMLIPACEEFITDMDASHRVITMNLPEGLVDMTLAEIDGEEEALDDEEEEDE